MFYIYSSLFYRFLNFNLVNNLQSTVIYIARTITKNMAQIIKYNSKVIHPKYYTVYTFVKSLWADKNGLVSGRKASISCKKLRSETI